MLMCFFLRARSALLAYTYRRVDTPRRWYYVIYRVLYYFFEPMPRFLYTLA